MKNNLLFCKGLIKINKTKYILSRDQATNVFKVILHYWWIKTPKPSKPCVPFIFLSFVKKKRNTKGCFFFVKTWNVLSKLESGKEMIFFSSLFCLSRRERLFYFDYYLFIFLNFNSFHCKQQIPKRKKETTFFCSASVEYFISFFLLLPIAHEYHILCCPLPNRITGSDFIFSFFKEKEKGFLKNL